LYPKNEHGKHSNNQADKRYLLFSFMAGLLHELQLGMKYKRNFVVAAV
jgi:hypothetical protein